MSIPYLKESSRRLTAVFILLNAASSKGHGINNNNNNNGIYFYSANSTIQFSNALYNSRENQINIVQIIIFTIIIHKSNQMLAFDERGKPDYPGKNLS